MKRIVFTKHALDKFVVLSRHGISVRQTQIRLIIRISKVVDSITRKPLYIYQGNLDKDHVIRVVCKHESRIIKVITFYPGRKKQYEKK